MADLLFDSLRDRLTEMTAKIGLATLVPPIGLPFIFKKHKWEAAFVGAILSGIASLSLGTGQKEVYQSNQRDLPGVYVTESFQGGSDALVSLVSPPLFINYTHKNSETRLRQPEGHWYIVQGGNAIAFDKKSQKYTLNLNQNKRFKISPDSALKYGRMIKTEDLSVSEAESRVSDLNGRLEKLTAQGDLIRARKVYDKIAAERAKYDSVLSQYNQTRIAYEAVVNIMNAELDSLKNSGKVKQGGSK
jgi:hypothetical protein